MHTCVDHCSCPTRNACDLISSSGCPPDVPPGPCEAVNQGAHLQRTPRADAQQQGESSMLPAVQQKADTASACQCAGVDGKYKPGIVCYCCEHVGHFQSKCPFSHAEQQLQQRHLQQPLHHCFTTAPSMQTAAVASVQQPSLKPAGWHVGSVTQHT